jgi:hypothetical protein
VKRLDTVGEMPMVLSYSLLPFTVQSTEIILFAQEWLKSVVDKSDGFSRNKLGMLKPS